MVCGIIITGQLCLFMFHFPFFLFSQLLVFDIFSRGRQWVIHLRGKLSFFGALFYYYRPKWWRRDEALPDLGFTFSKLFPYFCFLSSISLIIDYQRTLAQLRSIFWKQNIASVRELWGLQWTLSGVEPRLENVKNCSIGYFVNPPFFCCHHKPIIRISGTGGGCVFRRRCIRAWILQCWSSV